MAPETKINSKTINSSRKTVAIGQLSLGFPLVSRYEVEDAWLWLCNAVTSRPNVPSKTCVYDHKQWKVQGQYHPLFADGFVEKYLGVLFLTSELGDDEQIYDLANFGEAADITLPNGLLDRDVANVIQEKKGFRDSLSEHLAFWVRLANGSQVCNDDQRFAAKLPHVQSRDKGPDGLFITTGHDSYVEIQSVKSSMGDPRKEVGTRSFRSKGVVHNRKSPKQLEEFWLTANEN
jgi:hypothetical protein